MKFLVSNRYLKIPVSRSGEKENIAFCLDGKLVYELDVDFDEKDVQHIFHIDMNRFLGKELDIEASDTLLQFISFTDEKHENPNELYHEKFRPYFHFSSAQGWLNDPNGLYYKDGLYHLFYQHYPADVVWGPMHWGHAVSKDLFSWQEKDIALFPDESGTMFSGSAFIDEKNVTGLSDNENGPILLFYTSAGDKTKLSTTQEYAQNIAYSVDNGETFIKYEKNPIISQIAPFNRDPKVIYHEKSENYVMVLYLEKTEFAIFTSKNLLDWKISQKFSMDDRSSECPDFFPLYLDGNKNEERYVFCCANDNYLVGKFDGETFTPVQEEVKLRYSKLNYAAQTFHGEKEGRRIRIGWMNSYVADMPFCGWMSTPVELKLVSTSAGERLRAHPVSELNSFKTNNRNFNDIIISDSQPFNLPLTSKAFELQLEMEIDKDSELEIEMYNEKYIIKGEESVEGQECVAPINKKNLSFLIIHDTLTTEIYIENGTKYMHFQTACEIIESDISFKIKKGNAEIAKLAISDISKTILK